MKRIIIICLLAAAVISGGITFEAKTTTNKKSSTTKSSSSSAASITSKFSDGYSDITGHTYTMTIEAEDGSTEMDLYIGNNGINHYYADDYSDVLYNSPSMKLTR